MELQEASKINLKKFIAISYTCFLRGGNIITPFSTFFAYDIVSHARLDVEAVIKRV